MNVTICGPAASGKGTLARMVAKSYGFAHVDAGLVFRACTYGVQNELVSAISEMDFTGGSWRYEWDGEHSRITYHEQVIDDLASDELGRLTAERAANPEQLRAMLAVVEQVIGGFPSAVVDGRSAGTVLLPDAGCKFYIDASLDVRAARRHAQLSIRVPTLTLEEVRQSLAERDATDSARPFDPLRRTPDMHFLDTSTLDQEATFGRLLDVMEGGTCLCV